MARATRGLEKKDSSLMFREITPPHGWKEDPHFHYLRLTLPGFETKDITIHMDKYGHLVVRGNKQVTQHKYMNFEETFDVPENAELEEAEGRFEDNQIYCITIPKKNTGRHKNGHGDKDNPKGKDNKFGPIHKYGSTDVPAELSDRRIPNNPLNVITGEKSKKRSLFVFFIALLIALLVLIVFLVVKFRHR